MVGLILGNVRPPKAPFLTQLDGQIAHPTNLGVNPTALLRLTNLLRLVTGVALTFLAAQIQLHSVVAAELPLRDPIHRATSLAGGGDSAPLVVCPQNNAQLGREVVDALDKRFGIKAAICRDSEFDPRDYGQRTVILLGHLVNNREILWLYGLGQCFVDAAYPGGDGFVIRQMFDPVGNGRNVLLVGASSNAGLAKGVRRFIAELNRLETPVWKEALMVDSSASIVTNPPSALSDREFAKLERETFVQMKGGKLWLEAHKIIDAARHWHLSGHEVYLRQFDAQTRAHRELTDSGVDQLYGGLEFWMAEYIQAWDLVEESDYWSDAQRKEKTRLIVDLTARLATRYRSFNESPKPLPRWNHETFPAMAYFRLSEYLTRHYGDADPAPRFRRLAKLVLGDQTQFTRGTDESALYLSYSPAAAIRYAISTRDREFFDSGRARQFGRLLLAMIDSSGRLVGAANSVRENVAGQYLLPLAAVLNEPAFLGPDRRTRKSVEQPHAPRSNWDVPVVFGEFRPPLKPAFPKNDAQVEAHPLDPGLYDLTNTRQFYTRVPVVKTGVPQSRAFDKLTFREGHETAGQYLLLDGYGRGKHYRLDTQAILRFTDQDRVFLVGTDDDQRVGETFHNTMTFLRNGRGHASVPPMAELEAIADLPHTGFSRTSVRDYSGVNWTRNILWLKGSMFVVMDQMEALEDGDYSFRCHWHGLGTYSAGSDTFRFEQKGETCAITAGSPVAISVYEDRSEVAARWAGYSHANPVIHRVRQTQSVKLKRGGRTSIHNLIHTHPTTENHRVTAEFADAGRIAFRDGERMHLFTADAGSSPAGMITDAKLAHWSPERIALARATSLRFGEIDLLRAKEPVDVEIDLLTGTAAFSKDSSRAGVEFNKPPPQLRDALRTELSKLKKKEAPTETVAAASVSGFKAVETPLELQVTASLIASAGGSGDARVYVGNRSHCAAFSIGADGRAKPVWTAAADGQVNAIVRLKSSSGETLTVFGTQNGELAAIGPDGKVRWQYRIEELDPIEAKIVSLVAGDIDADGIDELFVGTARWYVHAFDAAGRHLWKKPAYARRMMSLALGDLSGDGSDDLLIGTSYYTLNAYNAQGKILFAHTEEPMFQRAIVADLDGDQRQEAIAANVNKITVIDVDRARLKPVEYRKGSQPPRPRSVRFRFDAGDSIHALELATPVAGDNVEIIAGAESGFIYRINGSGEPKGFANTGDAVLCLAPGRDPNDDWTVAAGLRNGSVVALDRNLKITRSAQLSHELKSLSLSRNGGVICVTKHSIGWLGWN